VQLLNFSAFWYVKCSVLCNECVSTRVNATVNLSVFFYCTDFGGMILLSDKVLYQLVLRSIQRLSSHIIADEHGFAEELKSKSL